MMEFKPTGFKTFTFSLMYSFKPLMNVLSKTFFSNFYADDDTSL